jgi:hypothetical protein
MKKRLIIVCFVAWSTTAFAQDCGSTLSKAGKQKIVQGNQEIVFSPNLWPIPVGKHFSLNLEVCGPAPVLVKMDADMPAHKHGMNYKPAISPLGPGMYRVDGLMFHMPGQWRVTFDVGTVPTSRLSQTITID